MNSLCSREQCENCPASINCRRLRVKEEVRVQSITALELPMVKEIRQTSGAGLAEFTYEQVSS